MFVHESVDVKLSFCFIHVSEWKIVLRVLMYIYTFSYKNTRKYVCTYIHIYMFTSSCCIVTSDDSGHLKNKIIHHCISTISTISWIHSTFYIHTYVCGSSYRSQFLQNQKVCKFYKIRKFAIFHSVMCFIRIILICFT